MTAPYRAKLRIGVPRERGGPARPIADLLPGALRALGVPSRAASRRVSVAWEQIADPAWRGRAAPSRLEGGALVVTVGSSPLREELAQFHAERLLAAMKAALPEDVIVSIRFEAGRVPAAVRPLEDASNDARGNRAAGRATNARTSGTEGTEGIEGHR